MSNIRKRASDDNFCKKYLNIIFPHNLLHLHDFTVNIYFDFCRLNNAYRMFQNIWNLKNVACARHVASFFKMEGGGGAEGRLIQKIKNLDKQKKENFSKS